MAKIQRSSKFKREDSIVPCSLELVRRNIHGEFEVLARNAASYNFFSDGALYITNGYRVSEISSSANTLLFRHRLIEMLRSEKT